MFPITTNSLRPTLIAALCAAVAAAAALPSMARAEVKIDGSVTVVESAQASGPVERATKDLLSDFNKVFGTTPRLVTTLAEAGPVSIVIGQGPEMPFGLKCSMATDTETFAFSIVKLPGKKQAVCLTGADMRGTIFAIYEFSQAYLGLIRCICGRIKNRRSAIRSCCLRILLACTPSRCFAIAGSFRTMRIC